MSDDPNRLKLERILEDPLASSLPLNPFLQPRYRCPVHGEAPVLVWSLRDTNGQIIDRVTCCGLCLFDLIRREIPSLPHD